MQFTREQCFELIEEDSAVRTDVDPSYRHGTYETYVVPFDGKFYQFTVSVHSQEGWDDFDTVDAYEVKQVQVMTTEWVAV